MGIRTAVLVALASAALTISCNDGSNAGQDEAPATKGSGVEIIYKDPGVPLVADAEEAKALIYWYDSESKTLNVFNADALHKLIAAGKAREIEWAPGQVIAQVMPGPGMQPVPAQVVPRQAIDDSPDAIYSQVGDMRRLKYLRMRHTFNGALGGCEADLRIAPLWRPAGTLAFRTARRYHEYMQHVGPIQAAEWVENTARYYFYPAADGGACRAGATIEERMPKWVSAVQAWP